MCDPLFRKSLRKAIQQTQKTHPFTIDAWILMPDHLHCIWTLPENDAHFSARWSLIKRYVTKQCHSHYHYHDERLMTASKTKRNESTIWQRRFWEHQIKNDKDFEHHMNYLHYNPVKHGLVEEVRQWEYSSFHRYVHHGIYPENWGGFTHEGNMEFGEP